MPHLARLYTVETTRPRPHSSSPTALFPPPFPAPSWSPVDEPSPKTRSHGSPFDYSRVIYRANDVLKYYRGRGRKGRGKRENYPVDASAQSTSRLSSSFIQNSFPSLSLSLSLSRISPSLSGTMLPPFLLAIFCNRSPSFSGISFFFGGFYYYSSF